MGEVLNLLDDIHGSIKAGTSIKYVDLKKLELLQIFSKNLPEEERSRRASVLLEKLKNIIYDAKNDEDFLLKLLKTYLLKIQVLVLFSSFEDCLYPQDDSDGLLEELLETISILAECGSEVHALIIISLSRAYMRIIIGANCLFGQKTEVLKSFNVLLQRCPYFVKQELIHSETFLEKLKLLFNLIFHIGDYEFQVGTLECIFRLLPRKVRPQYASKFIQNTEMISAFLMIKDGNFETDCRSFLNCLNKQMKDKKRVLSVPCLKAVLGKRKLTKPEDPGYDDFWVDFNFGSKRITIFCEQDSTDVYSQQSTKFEDMWETISIWESDVQSYQCSDGVRPTSAILVLKKNVKELFPHMVEAEGNELCLLFDEKWYVPEALRRTLGPKQQHLNKVSAVNEPLHLFMRNGTLQVDSLAKSITCPYQDATVSSQTEPFTSHTPVGNKMSIPSVPMRTPARYATPVTEYVSSSKLADSVSPKINTSKTVVNSRSVSIGESVTKDFKTPRTPQNKLKPRPKVKTPVVTVGAPRIKDKISQPQNMIKIQYLKHAENQLMTKERVCQVQKIVDVTVIPDSFPGVQCCQMDKKSGRKSIMEDSGIGLNESDLFSLQAQVQKQRSRKTTQDENEKLAPDISDTEKVRDRSSQKKTDKSNRSSSMIEKDDTSLTERNNNIEKENGPLTENDITKKIATCNDLLMQKEKVRDRNSQKKTDKRNVSRGKAQCSSVMNSQKKTDKRNVSRGKAQCSSVIEKDDISLTERNNNIEKENGPLTENDITKKIATCNDLLMQKEKVTDRNSQKKTDKRNVSRGKAQCSSEIEKDDISLTERNNNIEKENNPLTENDITKKIATCNDLLMQKEKVTDRNSQKKTDKRNVSRGKAQYSSVMNSQKKTDKRNVSRGKAQCSSVIEKDDISLTERNNNIEKENGPLTENDITKNIATCNDLLMHRETFIVSEPLKVVQNGSPLKVVQNGSLQKRSISNMQKEEISFHKHNSLLAKQGNKKTYAIRNRISPDTTSLLTDHSKSDLENVPNESDQFVVNESQDFESRFNNNKQCEVNCSEHYNSLERIDVQKCRKKIKVTSLDNNLKRSISKSENRTSDSEKHKANHRLENKQNKHDITQCILSPQINTSKLCKENCSSHQSVTLSKNYDEIDFSEISDSENLNVLTPAIRPQISEILEPGKAKLNIDEAISKPKSFSQINVGVKNLQSNCKQLKDSKIDNNISVDVSTEHSPCQQKSTNKHKRLNSGNTDTDTQRNKNDTENIIPKSLELNTKSRLRSGHMSAKTNSKDKRDPTSAHNKTTDEINSNQNYCLKANTKVATCSQKKSIKGKKLASQQLKSPTAAEVFANKIEKKKLDSSRKQNGKRKHKLYTSRVIEIGEYELTEALPEKSLAHPFNGDSNELDEMEIVTSPKDPERLLKAEQLSQTSLEQNKLVTSPDLSTDVKRFGQEEDQNLLSEPKRVLRKKKQSDKSLYVFDSPSSNSSISVMEIPYREKSKHKNKYRNKCSPVKPVKPNDHAKRPASRLLYQSFVSIHAEDNNGSDPYDFDAEIEKSSRCSGMNIGTLSKMHSQNVHVESKSKGDNLMNSLRNKKHGKEHKSKVTLRLNRWESFSKGYNKSSSLSKENDLDDFGFSCTNSQMVQNSSMDESDLSSEQPIMEGQNIELIKETCSKYSIHETKKTTKSVEWIEHRSTYKHPQSEVKKRQGKHSVGPALKSAQHSEKMQQQSSSPQEIPENGSPKEMVFGAVPTSESTDVLSNFSAVCKKLLLESSLKGGAGSEENGSTCGRSEISWIAKNPAAKRKMGKVYQRNVNEKWKNIQNSMDNDDLIMTSPEWELNKESPAYRVKCNVTQNSITPKPPPSRKKYSPLDVKVIQTPRTPKTPCSVSWSDADQEEEAVSTGLDQCCDLLDNTSSKDCDDVSVKCGSTNSKHSSIQNDKSSWKSILSSKIQSDMETQIANIMKSNDNDLISPPPTGIMSGPCTIGRPSKSTMKRKYPEVDSFSEENEDEVSSPEFQNTSHLIPRKLFRNESLQTPIQHESFSPTMDEKESGYEEVLHETSPLLLPDCQTSMSDDIALQSGIGEMIKTFGIDMKKNIIKEKHSHLEKVTSGALKSSQKHFSQLCMQQNQTRANIMDYFKKNIIGELQAMEKDVTALKNAEDQSVVFFKSQLKVLQNHKVSQRTRLTNLKMMHESLKNDLKGSEENEKSLQSNFSNVLKKDITEMQKKLLLDSQKKQLANVRKCLHGIFS